jgi:branched-chain amino acid transport system permease protein
MNGYYANLLIGLSITIILSLGLTINFNIAGMPNLSHIASFGISAYAFAIFAEHMNSFLAALIAITIATLSGGLIGFIAHRVRSDQFALVTLAALITFQILAKNLVSITYGPLGMSVKSGLNIGSFGISTPQQYAYFFFVCAIILCLIFAWFSRRRSYIIVRSLRDDEVLLSSMGYHIIAIKTVVISISGLLAGIAGVFFSNYISYIDPSSFTLNTMLPILLVISLAGIKSSLWKILLASVLVVALPEFLKNMPFPDSKLGALQQLTFGACLAIILIIHGYKMRPTRA